MRIGFDAKRLFNNFTGLGNYSRTLLEDLSIYFPDNEYFLFTPKVKPSPQTNPFINNPFFQVVYPKSRFKNWWRTSGIKNDLLDNKIDIYHGLSHELPIKIRGTKIPSVVTIHDLIFKQFPNQYSKIDRSIYDIKFKYACKNADVVIAISESTKKDIVHYYGIEPNKIKVIYQTCGEHFKIQHGTGSLRAVQKKYKLPERFLLSVGAVIERKDLESTIRALSLLSKEELIPLVVVGRGGKYLDKVKKLIQQLDLNQSVVFLQPENKELPAIYQLAEIFLYPSRCEGFGIPIIESLNCKTPVITTNTSALPEAAGPGAHYVAPQQPNQIAEGIRKILNDKPYALKLSEEGFKYVQKFDSKLITEEIIKTYKKILNS